MYKYLHFHKKITIEVSYNNDVSLQNALSLVSNLTLNVLTRFFHSTLGFSKTKLILTELNNFNIVRFKQFHKRFITKSSDDKSDVFNRQASAPYSRTGIHLHRIISSVTSSEAILPNTALAQR